jgi:hypothetical protein
MMTSVTLYTTEVGRNGYNALTRFDWVFFKKNDWSFSKKKKKKRKKQTNKRNKNRATTTKASDLVFIIAVVARSIHRFKHRQHNTCQHDDQDEKTVKVGKPRVKVRGEG